MNVKEGYDIWASQYDTNENKTRDLEAYALRDTLKGISFERCLEIGCGTGKNTEWLAKRAHHVTAVDFSDNMLAKAREKLNADNVQFRQADIKTHWSFADELYDLITFSLVLEHIENLDHVFREASQCLTNGGHIYIGELHPCKQYAGTKARFDTQGGRKVLECFVHHTSDFILGAGNQNLSIVDLEEYFDNNDRKQMPRILTLLLRKKG